ncbi:transposase [Saccharothrix sp. ALI-22-I]|uniref:transposase n=1 Tax=Saccharothrix sp. ALI-22-I TaxID=1933778 RepID=UPI001EE6AD36|nr:transposase [Saccharothrix sp. ALI-22-I]
MIITLATERCSTKGCVISVHHLDRNRALGELSGFRREFHRCLTRRADGLFELADAVLCADGPVRTLVGLSLEAEHRRGHGGLYDAVNNGRIEVDRLRDALVGMPLPRAADGRLVLAVDVSPWLRPDGATCPDRSFCHVYGRGKGEHRMIPGWPYSFVACACRNCRPCRSGGAVILVEDAAQPLPSADVEMGDPCLVDDRLW